MNIQDVIHKDPVAAALYVLRVFLWLLVLFFLLRALPAQARPVAFFQEGDTRITLYDEPCKLDVKLQYRITWQEKDKKYEGCWGLNQGIIVGYFDDKSIGIFPSRAFRPVTES